MKKAIYFAHVRNYWQSEAQIFEATTVKGRRVWGRNAEGLPTNWSVRDETGRFNSKEEAEACLNLVSTGLEGHRKRLAEARERCRELEHEFNEERARLISGVSTYVG